MNLTLALIAPGPGEFLDGNCQLMSTDVNCFGNRRHQADLQEVSKRLVRGSLERSAEMKHVGTTNLAGQLAQMFMAS